MPNFFGFHIIKSILALLGARTANVSWNTCALFVAINVLTHYLVDSYRINKAVDQGLHVTVAIVTAPLLTTLAPKRGH